MIRPPPSSGSYYCNYKHYHSIVLLVMVDADYKFLCVDVGCNGIVTDGGVFKNSTLYKALETNALQTPTPRPLPGSNSPFHLAF